MKEGEAVGGVRPKINTIPPELEPNNSRKKNGLVFVFVFAITVIGLGLLSFYQYNNLLGPVEVKGSEKIVINIPKGASTGLAAKLLQEKKLIHSSAVFKLYFRINKFDGKLKPGDYSLKRNMSVPEIAKKLVAGSVISYSFTIPEGFNTKQIADSLEKKGFINRQKFMQLVATEDFGYDFLQDLPQNERRLEGYLFPDTYHITQDTDEKAILQMMLDRFNQEISADYSKKAEALGLSLHEAITLASIIEREAVKDSERVKVSAVFHNRLRIGMKLESCATIQYALGEQKTRLLYSDLRIESPYNTYKYSGLPPGPIASPGSPSLKASVNPENVDYLFFVVSENGEHSFSETLAQHNKAKAKYVTRFKTP